MSDEVKFYDCIIVLLRIENIELRCLYLSIWCPEVSKIQRCGASWLEERFQALDHFSLAA